MHEGSSPSHRKGISTDVKNATSSATFHGWKDVDLIVRRVVEEEDEDNLLNEGFRHYSIINDDE